MTCETGMHRLEWAKLNLEQIVEDFGVHKDHTKPFKQVSTATNTLTKVTLNPEEKVNNHCVALELSSLYFLYISVCCALMATYSAVIYIKSGRLFNMYLNKACCIRRGVHSSFYLSLVGYCG